MKVCKFGGTSMATPESIRQVESIIKSDPESMSWYRRGKRFKGDTKVTDLFTPPRRRGTTASRSIHRGNKGQVCNLPRPQFETDIAAI